MKREQTWAERLAASDQIDIRPVPEGRRSMTPGKAMLYPSARMVDDAIRAIPDGPGISPRELRALLANQYDAEYTCPVTTTMMLRIVAEAANEAHERGVPLGEVTPVWRVLDRKAPALRKLSFDSAWLLGQRAEEGLPS
ncbi:MAG: hypothetical protein M3457_12265 [Chloroflexota bacterium]|nr:hypothetical protein [Chloroflexota bacterium]